MLCFSMVVPPKTIYHNGICAMRDMMKQSVCLRDIQLCFARFAWVMILGGMGFSLPVQADMQTTLSAAGSIPALTADAEVFAYAEAKEAAACTFDCLTPNFVDVIPENAWVNIDLAPNQGTSGLKNALSAARDLHPNSPVRIRLAPGVYADNLGAEIFAQRLLRTSGTPIYIVASGPAPNATQLGHGINLLGVSYIAIDGVTIGPRVVGAWNGSSHAAPFPLQAAAGIHVSGAALYADQNAVTGGVINFGIFGQYQPSHHIIVRHVTIQNLFELDAQSGETSIGQGMDGMKFNQVEDLWVYGNSVTQTSRHGIDNVGVHRAVFSNNIIANTGGGHGIEAKGGSVDVIFEKNTFYRVRRVELGGENTDATYYFSADGRWDYEALRLAARNNLIIDPREAALEFSGCADCTAVGNTIFFTSAYQVPTDLGTVYGGDAIRIHDSQVLGSGDGAGSDCQFWNGNDYITITRCWGVGSNAPAPVGNVLRSSNVTVTDNVFASANGIFSAALGGSTIPCPLNVIDGTADLHFDANYWWNGANPLPNSGCTALPEGPHSVYSTTTATPSPGFSDNVDATSLSSLAATAITALTPASTSPIVGAGVASPALPAEDHQERSRPTPPSIGALEPCSFCNKQPVAPQSGWWWNPAESGRGFAMEKNGGNLFLGAYLYDATGRATWYVSGGPMTSSSTYQGHLLEFAGGQTLTGAYRAATPTGSVGTVTLQFNDATHATLTWPGGTVAIQRFEIVPGGLTAPPAAFQPETGWWWNSNESGRGFALEIQNGALFIGGYMYDGGGNPVWYISGNATTTQQLYQGSWAQYANGQTLSGSYRSPTVVSSNVGSLSIQFTDTRNAILTLPDGRRVPITRFKF